jgi:methyltransferase (TIGR00027 family)
MRAEESARSDRLFEDPFAASLAGEAGREALRNYRVAVGVGIPIIEVRTRYFDEALARTTERGTRQLVIIAAGMDARAFRLRWPSDMRVFELDQPEVIETKDRILAGATPRCERRALSVDLSRGFADALADSSFDREQPTVWLVEGLLQYLEHSAVDRVFEQIEQLSACGSTLLYDVVGATLMRAPALQALLQHMRELGAPWIFASDEPTGLVTARGWSAEVTDPSVIGNAWGRLPYPAPPADAGGVPRGYLIEAHKP